MSEGILRKFLPDLCRLHLPSPPADEGDLRTDGNACQLKNISSEPPDRGVFLT
jgi:hypothetical protein